MVNLWGMFGNFTDTIILFIKNQLMQNPNFEPQPLKPLSEESKKTLKKVGIVVGGVLLAFFGALFELKKSEKKDYENTVEDTNFEIINE